MQSDYSKAITHTKLSDNTINCENYWTFLNILIRGILISSESLFWIKFVILTIKKGFFSSLVKNDEKSSKKSYEIIYKKMDFFKKIVYHMVRKKLTDSLTNYNN